MAILRIRNKETGEMEEILCLRGEKGERGKDGVIGKDGAAGKDGYTPVKGVDYFTDGDKEELVADVLAALPVAEGVAF